MGQKTLITIEEISDKGKSLKIKGIGQDGSHVYTVFKTKQDGSPTQAYLLVKNKTIGDQITFAWETYNGEYQGKAYTSRTVKFVDTEEKKPFKPEVQKPFINKEPVKETDWTKIAEGKVRNSVAVAFINNQSVFGEETVRAMNEWVNWIMKGSVNKTEQSDKSEEGWGTETLDEPPF